MVFHLRAGGCGGCGDKVDNWIRSAGEKRVRVVECVSPRHADIVIVSGPLRGPFAETGKSVVEQAPEGCPVIMLGDCAAGGGPLCDALGEEAHAGWTIKADLEVDGCPVEKQSLSKGVKRCLGLI